MWERVQAVLDEAFARLGAVIAADLPGIVAMLIVLVSAIVAAFVIRAILRTVLTRVGFDRRARELGMTTRRDLGPRQEPSWIVARFAFWLVVVAGIALALEVLGASTMTAFGLSLLVFLPKLVVGALILLVGIGVARFLERSALINAVNQQIRQARLIALAVKWLVLVLAAAMALEHVGIGGELPTLAFAIVVGGIVLAVALAVGLGAREAVSRALDREARGEARPGEPGTPAPEDKVQHL
ncbi:hypothetical protein [Anaeromyxobacter terrae]|uniref:hypothetical protein n=1 Tax=Anaeromyxobacter terrae TaxID=2925406 RepID=UPI001F5785FA|nr:hypothetical protein [Anaeromyxobacter sp. SG22]